MIEIASRKRSQPAPPHVLFEALTEPNRDPARPWLHLKPDEHWPQVVETDEPGIVVWSSPDRPDARIRFQLPSRRPRLRHRSALDPVPGRANA